MELIVGKNAGFCPGVTNAILKAEKELNTIKENLYCLGELSHNKQVMKNLMKKGLIVVDSLIEIPNKSKVIFRAHGVPKITYEEAKKKELEIVDLSCPNVLSIHSLAEKLSLQDFFIFFIAEKGHPETIGTEGFCTSYTIIEKQEDIEEAIKDWKKTNLSKTAIISQTTFSLESFETIAQILQQKLQNTIEVHKTICDATRIRQTETIFLAKEVDCMIIIGGKNSNNTKKLYEISQENCKKAIWIESKDELEKETLNRYSKIGIMAGASTPKESIEDVITYLKS